MQAALPGTVNPRVSKCTITGIIRYKGRNNHSWKEQLSVSFIPLIKTVVLGGLMLGIFKKIFSVGNTSGLKTGWGKSIGGSIHNSLCSPNSFQHLFVTFIKNSMPPPPHTLPSYLSTFFKITLSVFLLWAVSSLTSLKPGNLLKHLLVALCLPLVPVNSHVLLILFFKIHLIKRK